jgi:hypothetical protein
MCTPTPAAGSIKHESCFNEWDGRGSTHTHTNECRRGTAARPPTQHPTPTRNPNNERWTRHETTRVRYNAKSRDATYM